MMDWEVSSLASFKVSSQHVISDHTSNRTRLCLLMCSLTLASFDNALNSLDYTSDERKASEEYSVNSVKRSGHLDGQTEKKHEDI
jgi:hypothetical protein